MTEFSDLGLAEPILRALTKEGYTTPTPIQAEVIPASLEGHDVMGIAQTGTGKTAAFVLPMLHRVVESNLIPKPKSCGALIIAPTRELVSQIHDNVRAYGRFIRPAMTMIVGGVKLGPQVKAMAPGVDILVATPGRLLDHLNSGKIRLDQTHTIVLDEADQMMDMGFLPAIRQIMQELPKERQTILLSATMPKQIKRLADDFLTNPAEISVAQQSRPIERIEQSVIHSPREGKKDLLLTVLNDTEHDRAIIFTRTKNGANKVTTFLEKAGLAATAIHGNKTQGQRMRALQEFKRGDKTILVATDVAARGIDIDDVGLVVNYELPNVPEAYVHRIGRTGRAGRSGIAVSFCEGEERGYLRDIERIIGSKLNASGELQEEVDPPKPGQRRRAPARPQGQKPRRPRNDEGRPAFKKTAGDREDRAQEKKGSWSPSPYPRNDEANDGQRRSKPRRQDRPRSFDDRPRDEHDRRDRGDRPQRPNRKPRFEERGEPRERHDRNNRFNDDRRGSQDRPQRDFKRKDDREYRGRDDRPSGRRDDREFQGRENRDWKRRDDREFGNREDRRSNGAENRNGRNRNFEDRNGRGNRSGEGRDFKDRNHRNSRYSGDQPRRNRDDRDGQRDEGRSYRKRDGDRQNNRSRNEGSSYADERPKRNFGDKPRGRPQNRSTKYADDRKPGRNDQKRRPAKSRPQ